MIFLEENKVNPIVIQAYNSINNTLFKGYSNDSTTLFLFLNETTKEETFIVLENKSNSIASYDLFELSLSSNVIKNKITSFDDDTVYLRSGQYTMYLYDIPIDYNNVYNELEELNSLDIPYKIYSEIDKRYSIIDTYNSVIIRTEQYEILGSKRPKFLIYTSKVVVKDKVGFIKDNINNENDQQIIVKNKYK